MARQVREPALRAYLTSLRRYPLLEPQEEHALALRYVGSRSPALATELVTRNLRLVVKIAFEYRRTPLGMLDLIQEGNLGLVRAVEKYDPNRGAKLASYAAWWIRAYILRFIQEHWHLVKIRSTNANRRLFFGLRRELAKRQQEGRETDSGQLAAALRVSERDLSIVEPLMLLPCLRLDGPARRDGDESRTLAEVLGDDVDRRPDRLVEADQTRALVRRSLSAIIAELPERERQIIGERLCSDDPVKLAQLARRFGVSRERMRQIQGQLLKRLRLHLEGALGTECELP